MKLSRRFLRRKSSVLIVLQSLVFACGRRVVFSALVDFLHTFGYDVHKF